MAGRAKGGYWYATALRESDLPSHARHLGHVLASVADNETGRVRVSLSWLEQSSGLSRSSVTKYLNVLEVGGWVRRRRAPKHRQIQDHEATVYTTVIPATFPAKASPSHGLGLVRESERASASHGPSTTSTKADAGTALRASGATETPASEPLSTWPPVCRCTDIKRTKDGDCLGCGWPAA